MSRPKCKIVKVWNEGDVVEDIGRGLFRLISKAPVSKPAKAPVKLPSKPQGSAQTAKQTITPSQPLRALRRTQSCDPFVRWALRNASRRQLHTLYSDPRLTAFERDLIFRDLMENRRTYLP
jgi:uncharacterized protein YjiS (DUF1127 family)